MSPGIKNFLARWAITALGVLVAANIVDGIRYETTGAVIVASLLLGIFNGILRPILLLLSLPLLLVTLGLFTLVINGLLLYLVGYFVKPFHVDGYWAAFKGALVISIVSLFANALIGKKKDAVPPRKPPEPPRRESGPVIDV